MKRLTIEEITAAIGGRLLQGEPTDTATGVSTDSRKVEAGELFFPLIGEQHDAHDFIPQALERGCRTIVLSRQPEISSDKYSNINLILVRDTTKALQDLSAYYLSQLSLIKIGVTGSTGKTSTKEMLYWIFSEKYKAFRNVGNLNNHIGLPLTVLSLPEDTEAGIFEMGMSELGEIDLLSDIVRPNIGIITNIGISHIENLGSRENILKAKMEITNYFDEAGTLIVNEDSDFLSRDMVSGNYRTVTTGETGRSDFILSNINDYGEDGIEFTIEFKEAVQSFRLKVPGRHNAYNGALAVAAGVLCGITMKEAAAGLLKLEITDKRLNIKGKNGMKIIDDTYNASPDSMKAAIDVLTVTKGFRKIAILADMFELGENAAEFHRQVGRYAADHSVDLLFAVGSQAKYIAAGAKEILGADKIHYYETKELLMDDIGSMISSGDVILLKGSRGMAMDQVVKKIMEMN
ncbi:UDP-N-acetylmuramoyl-tripeptide--D-alanyl-D-alanine ligase [Anoxybacterium hadale]|uniref:UDP-N-acetylmuramoyl-tripeptide--D-alanyl-D-alanine ligase n=1 Tax=Anoxybacterium hadale TaxID=3408580 RepID=A0ACD1AB41_9FIRM|nr:UDP-N-acetylmuramoyl-tripeptide--D-alanyl-D-alanine ligase [Clostridiales bacterium]